MQAPLFDQDQAIDILEAFERVSGLGGTLFVPDADGVHVQVLFSRNACAGKCPHCLANDASAQEAFAHRSTAVEEEVDDDEAPRYKMWSSACQKTHCQAADFAERFGGRYFYQCNEDRLFFAAPIIADAGCVAAITVGPVHIYELEKSRSSDPHLRPFPVRNPAYIEHLSQLLASCAVSVSDSSQSLLRMMRSITMQQQREISSAVARSKHTPSVEHNIILEEGLVQAIEEGDSVTARMLLNELLGRMLATPHVSAGDTLAHRISDLLTVCSRAALRAGVASETVFETTEEYRLELTRLNSDEQRSFCIQRYVEQMTVLVERLRSTNNEDAIYRSIEYILSNYNRKISLDDVASEVGFSPAYFSRQFKKKFGQSFNAYLTKVRIEASKNNLLATDLSITEVAEMSGFADASYFTRSFKRQVGVTPGYFRSHRGQIEKDRYLSVDGGNAS